jgi:hypothetical protein
MERSAHARPLSILAGRKERAQLMIIGTYRPADVIISEHPLRTVTTLCIIDALARRRQVLPLVEGDSSRQRADRPPI